MAVYQNVERLAVPAARAGKTERQSLHPPFGRMLIACAVLLSVVLPLEGLIVALVMRRREHSPRRRRLLTGWAIGSAVWMCVSTALGMAIIAALAYGPPVCQGGIDYSVLPTHTKAAGQNWTVTYTCLDGGTYQETEPSMSMSYRRLPAGSAQPLAATSVRWAGQI
jgi:hypothetical protein